jgi:hypothetical protein
VLNRQKKKANKARKQQKKLKRQVSWKKSLSIYNEVWVGINIQTFFIFKIYWEI